MPAHLPPCLTAQRGGAITADKEIRDNVIATGAGPGILEVINFDALVEHQMIKPQDLGVFDIVDTVEDAWTPLVVVA